MERKGQKKRTEGTDGEMKEKKGRSDCFKRVNPTGMVRLFVGIDYTPCDVGKMSLPQPKADT